MAAAVETRRVCETAGCSSEAKMQCPTCLKLGIQGSYFCSQVRFLAAQPLARRSGRAAGAGSSSPRRLPAARARPGSASLPARPGRPGAAAPGQGSRTKFPLRSSVVGAGLAAPGGAGAPFLLVAAGDVGSQRHYSTAGAFVSGCTDVPLPAGVGGPSAPLKDKGLVGQSEDVLIKFQRVRFSAGVSSGVARL